MDNALFAEICDDSRRIDEYLCRAGLVWLADQHIPPASKRDAYSRAALNYRQSAAALLEAAAILQARATSFEARAARGSK